MAFLGEEALLAAREARGERETGMDAAVIALAKRVARRKGSLNCILVVVLLEKSLVVRSKCSFSYLLCFL